MAESLPVTTANVVGELEQRCFSDFLTTREREGDRPPPPFFPGADPASNPEREGGRPPFSPRDLRLEIGARGFQPDRRSRVGEEGGGDSRGRTRQRDEVKGADDSRWRSVAIPEEERVTLFPSPLFTYVWFWGSGWRQQRRRPYRGSGGGLAYRCFAGDLREESAVLFAEEKKTFKREKEMGGGPI